MDLKENVGLGIESQQELEEEARRMKEKHRKMTSPDPYEPKIISDSGNPAEEGSEKASAGDTKEKEAKEDPSPTEERGPSPSPDPRKEVRSR